MNELPQSEAQTATPADGTIMIVPAYNEASGVGRVIEDLRRNFTKNILVVVRSSADGKGDGTEMMARNGGAEVINQVGHGKGDAINLALRYISERYPTIRFIGMIDADCTYSSTELGAMRTYMLSNPSIGMVVGVRRNFRNNGAVSIIFAAGNRLLAGIHQRLNSISLADPLSGLRLINFDAIRNWSPQAKGFDVEVELNHYVASVKKMEIAEVPVEYRERVGDKKLGVLHGVQILARMIRLWLGSYRHVARPSNLRTDDRICPESPFR